MTLAINALSRARAYLAVIPGAVSGSGGHNQTFAVACSLVHGFALSEYEALVAIREYNQRCQPPWSERELLQKVKSALRASHANARGHLLDPVKGFAPRHSVSPTVSSPNPSLRNEQKPDRSGFGSGTREQLKRLSELRGIGLEGLLWAQERGVLSFGWWNGFECFDVTDTSGRILELRRLDGNQFPAHGQLSERKSHAVRGSKKAWPIGIIEAQMFPCIALVEGVPDFLAAHYLVLWEQASHYSKRDVRCAPVALLSANPAIDPAALLHFKDKTVRIFPHADSSGLKGARKWQRQLLGAGTARCDIFDLTQVHALTGGRAKDLNDFLCLNDPVLFMKHPQLFKVLPDTDHEFN